MTGNPITTVDAYIAAQPEAAQPVLTPCGGRFWTPCPARRESSPTSTPTYRTPGGALLTSPAGKSISRSTRCNAAMQARFAAELARYEIEKGTIRFGWTSRRRST